MQGFLPACCWTMLRIKSHSPRAAILVGDFVLSVFGLRSLRETLELRVFARIFLDYLLFM